MLLGKRLKKGVNPLPKDSKVFLKLHNVGGKGVEK